MLGAVKVWALAHLLVNGDLASVILFGGLLAWAVVRYDRDQPDGAALGCGLPRGLCVNDVIYVVLSVVLFGVIVAIHTWLGYPPVG